MSSDPSISEILDKYLRGTATDEEQRIVEKWYEDIREDGEEVRMAPLAEKERLFRVLQRSARFRKTRRRRPFLLQPSWKAAAVWIGLLVGGFSILRLAKVKSGGNENRPVYVRVSTGQAEVRKVRLPDSSDVWLNANTVLQYAADFTNHRRVVLQGEALFDVTHQPDRPFSIETKDGLTTEVLGTRFDIESYEKMPISEITVIDGRIMVSRSGSSLGVLVRGQSMAYHREDGGIVRSTVSRPESMSGWINGEWDFYDKNIDDLALLMNNQFGIKLVYRRSDLAKVKISVNFNARQRAEEILGIFCAFTDTQFRWGDSHTVEIY